MKIEKNIPIPEQRGRKPNGTYSSLMGQMQVGDSFLAEGEKLQTVQSAVRQAAHRAGIKITTRREEEDEHGNKFPEGIVKLRVWRVEGEPTARHCTE